MTPAEYEATSHADLVRACVAKDAELEHLLAELHRRDSTIDPGIYERIRRAEAGWAGAEGANAVLRLELARERRQRELTNPVDPSENDGPIITHRLDVRQAGTEKGGVDLEFQLKTRPGHTHAIPCPACVAIVASAPEGCNDAGGAADYHHPRAIAAPSPAAEPEVVDLVEVGPLGLEPRCGQTSVLAGGPCQLQRGHQGGHLDGRGSWWAVSSEELALKPEVAPIVCRCGAKNWDAHAAAYHAKWCTGLYRPLPGPSGPVKPPPRKP